MDCMKLKGGVVEYFGDGVEKKRNATQEIVLFGCGWRGRGELADKHHKRVVMCRIGLRCG